MKRTASKVKIKTKKVSPVRVRLRQITIALIVVIAIGTSYIYSTNNSKHCANSESCLKNPVEQIENGKMGVFLGKLVPAPTILPLADRTSPTVLGTNDPTAEKHIYVDLSKQKIYAYEGETQIFETWTSTGRWGRTPTGNFNIWSKLRSTRMSGGSGADYYNLPNVPFTMYFYRDYGIHGAYWHDNFGYTMSHGCVNLRQIDAEILFNWADGPTNGAKGTAVSVCDSFTSPNICEQKNPVQ